VSVHAPANGPELVADYACLSGECPLWHPMEKKLYWVDVLKGQMYRYDPLMHTHEPSFLCPGKIGGFTVQADGGLLLFLDKGGVKILSNGQLTTVFESTPGEENTRFNDVIADPRGRVFCGTRASSDHAGSMYRLETDGKLTKLFGGVRCSNGMGFTPDHRGFYFIDSTSHEVALFDYEESTGDLSHRRVFVKLPASLGLPDGMTVDAKGYPWVGVWGGGCLVRYTPDGKEDRRVYFNAKLVTGCTFGGEDYVETFVTTAGGDDRKANGTAAGALFKMRTGIKGVAEFFSRVHL
jgi:sugar lactone lactonase YvrE